MKESELLKQIQLIASKMGARLFRNNVGKSWIGKPIKFETEQTITVGPGDVLIRYARRFESGLCKGSHDLIGWCPLKITKEHEGQTFAIFFSVEAKTGKLKLTPEQSDFMDAVNLAGGRAVEIRDVPELIENEIKYVGDNAGGIQ